MTFVFQITLVRYDDDGEGILVLNTENLLVERADFLEGVAGGDGIHKKETLAGTHVLFAHSTTKVV